MNAAYHCLHAVWRHIPISLRRAAFQAVTDLLGPRPGAVGAVRPGPATVLGLLNSTTGLGEGARLCQQALTALGINTNGFDVSPAFLTADLPTPPDLGIAPKAQEGGVLIAHLNPHMLPLALMQFGRPRLQGKYVIGYWAWELERIPDKWVSGFKYVHEIWVPSHFTAAAFQARTALPVRVVPHPVTAPLASARSRAEFGCDSAQFVVLTLLHMGSGFVRKNPLAAIRAFRHAFGTDQRYLLLVKIADSEVHPPARDELHALIGAAPNIRLLEEKLSVADMAALLACSDTILSLHRSEGFGLVLAQAMLLGKPVVATGWSGNMDFMQAQNSAPIAYTLVPVDDPQQNYPHSDQRWAEPDIEHAAAWLQRLAREPELRRQLGSAAKADTDRLFNLEAYRALVQPALAPYCQTGKPWHPPSG